MEFLASSENKWWDIASQCPWTTFFHTPIWQTIAVETRDNAVDSSFVFKTDTGVEGVFPLVTFEESVQKFGISKSVTHAESTFAGCYGGPIAEDQISIDLGILEKKISAGITKVTENPISPDINSLAGEYEEDFTQLIRLSEYSDIDEIEADMSKSRRRYIRKARREGLEVREANSLTEWKSYFEAYEESLERWDNVSSRYSWEFIRQIREMAQEYPDNIKLWLTFVDDSVASGAIVFYWNSHADYWHGASFEKYFDHNPNGILHSEIMRDAMERGFDYYDFNPSGGNEGVVRFKEKFGAERVPIKRWKSESWSYRQQKRLSELAETTLNYIK